ASRRSSDKSFVNAVSVVVQQSCSSPSSIHCLQWKHSWARMYSILVVRQIRLVRQVHQVQGACIPVSLFGNELERRKLTSASPFQGPDVPVGFVVRRRQRRYRAPFLQGVPADIFNMAPLPNRTLITTSQLFAAAISLTILSTGSQIRAAGPNPACALVKASEI